MDDIFKSVLAAKKRSSFSITDKKAAQILQEAPVIAAKLKLEMQMTLKSSIDYEGLSKMLSQLSVPLTIVWQSDFRGI